jgi:hypothetical protein
MFRTDEYSRPNGKMEVLKVSDFEKPSNGSRNENPKISKTRFKPKIVKG